MRILPKVFCVSFLLFVVATLSACGGGDEESTPTGGAGLAGTTINDVRHALPSSVTTMGGTVVFPQSYPTFIQNALINGTFTSAQLDFFLAQINSFEALISETDATSWNDLVVNFPDVVTQMQSMITDTASSMGCQIAIGSNGIITISQNGEVISVQPSAP